jgi:hypothetical protein
MTDLVMFLTIWRPRKGKLIISFTYCILRTFVMKRSFQISLLIWAWSVTLEKKITNSRDHLFVFLIWSYESLVHNTEIA